MDSDVSALRLHSRSCNVDCGRPETKLGHGHSELFGSDSHLFAARIEIGPREHSLPTKLTAPPEQRHR
jgi:hypothetical protein